MAQSIPVAMNRLAAFLVPGSTAEQQAGITGVMKLVLRWENYSVPARDAALVLTQAEQGVLLRGARRLLVKLGTKIFLVAAFLDFARHLIAPNEETKSAATRLQIIEAHILKGGPLWTRAIGVAEQVLFLLTDDLGQTMADVAAGIFANFDAAGPAVPTPFFNLDRGGYYAELASPADLDAVDSIFTFAPSVILQPAILPFPIGAETFPAGPMPSWGQRH